MKCAIRLISLILNVICCFCQNESKKKGKERARKKERNEVVTNAMPSSLITIVGKK